MESGIVVAPVLILRVACEAREAHHEDREVFVPSHIRRGLDDFAACRALGFAQPDPGTRLLYAAWGNARARLRASESPASITNSVEVVAWASVRE
jgi:hypothetical protein